MLRPLAVRATEATDEVVFQGLYILPFPLRLPCDCGVRRIATCILLFSKMSSVVELPGCLSHSATAYIWPVFLHLIKCFLHCIDNCLILYITDFLRLDEIVVITICDYVILVSIQGRHRSRARRVCIHCHLFCFCQRCETEHVVIHWYTL